MRTLRKLLGEADTIIKESYDMGFRDALFTLERVLPASEEETIQWVRDELETLKRKYDQ